MAFRFRAIFTFFPLLSEPLVVVFVFEGYYKRLWSILILSSIPIDFWKVRKLVCVDEKV